MNYAIAIATRNRLSMLSASMPLFQQQSRPPTQIIVVDFSDDFEGVQSLCSSLDRQNGVPVKLIRSDRGNLPYQRNLALRHVTEDVVAMPDDDSFWYPDTGLELLSVYEQDVAGLIGAVTAVEVHKSPASPTPETRPRNQRITQRRIIASLRNQIEDLVAPHPFNLFSREQINRLRAAAEAMCLPGPFVETIGGFRMSFRSGTIKKIGFDDVLGSRIGYAQHEDKDASLRVLEAGQLLAAAPRARVFHNAHPGKRAGGFAYGFFQIFNYAYICAKVMNHDVMSVAVARYLTYKTRLYWMARKDEYSTQVYLGAKAAARHVRPLMETAAPNLSAVYADITARHLVEMNA